MSANESGKGEELCTRRTPIMRCTIMHNYAQNVQFCTILHTYFANKEMRGQILKKSPGHVMPSRKPNGCDNFVTISESQVGKPPSR